MIVLRAADYRRMPWRNGGGETAEIAVFPDGAGLDDFVWRLSMATVATSGPFSAFAGVDRTLAILDGDGMMLDIAGREPVRLTPASEPLAFAADVPTAASLIGGPVVDLNVMTRRGVVGHVLMRHSFEGSLDLDPSPGTSLLFCASGQVRVDTGSSMDTLDPRDTLILDEPLSRVSLRSDGPAEIYCITVR